MKAWMYKNTLKYDTILDCEQERLQILTLLCFDPHSYKEGFHFWSDAKAKWQKAQSHNKQHHPELGVTRIILHLKGPILGSTDESCRCYLGKM